MILNVVVLLLSHVVVPWLFVVSLWRDRSPSKVVWLTRVLGYGTYILYLVLAGAGWSWVSYYFRLAVPVAFLVAVAVSLRRISRSAVPWWQSPGSANGWSSLVVNVVIALVFAGSTVVVVDGFTYDDVRPADLSFPLRGGVFHVVHGGASPALNYHNVNRAQRFALDIVELNAAGTRASGIYPADPARYAAFGEEIPSPCAGEVIETRDGLPEHDPPDTDRVNAAGNHVVVRCAEHDVDVVLAHMQEGSVAVERGQSVEEGQVIGRLGNSGNTSEPHLHIHAVRTGSGSTLDGEGVPLLFDGQFLVRNSLVIR